MTFPSIVLAMSNENIAIIERNVYDTVRIKFLLRNNV